MYKVIRLVLLSLVCLNAYAQEKSIPNVDIKTLNNTTTNTAEIDFSSDFTLLLFWTTCCKPCINELNTITENIDDWVDEFDVTVIAVSIDDVRNMSKVKPKVNAEMWEFDFYCDPNKDFARPMGVSKGPHLFLVNKEKKILWEHFGFIDGDEFLIYEQLSAFSER